MPWNAWATFAPLGSGSDFAAGTLVGGGDADGGRTLAGSPHVAACFVDNDGNGAVGASESVYLQGSPCGPATTAQGDLRLTSSPGHPGGTVVRSVDADVSLSTVAVPGAAYEYADLNGDAVFGSTDVLYLRVGSASAVTTGWVRLNGHGGYPPFGRVAAGESDQNSPASDGPVSIGGESYFDADGDGVFEATESLYLDMNGDGQVSVADLRLDLAHGGLTVYGWGAAVFDSRTSAPCPAGCAYIFGGYVPGSYYTDRIVRYNPAAGSFSLMSAHLPTPRMHLAAAWDGSSAYLFGGWTSSEFFADILRYDPVTDSLQTMSSTLPVPSSPSAAYADGRFWLFGGLSPSGPLSSVLRYDPSADQLTTMPSTIPGDGLEHASAIGVGSFVYLVGGSTPAQWSSTKVLRYSVAGDSFSERASLNPGRTYQSAVYDGSRYVYVIGGTTDGGDTDLVDRFDTSTSALARMQDRLPSPAGGQAAAWGGGSMFLFGSALADPASYSFTPSSVQAGAYPSSPAPAVTTGATTSAASVQPTSISSEPYEVQTVVVTETENVTQLVTQGNSSSNESASAPPVTRPPFFFNPAVLGIGGAALALPLGYALFAVLGARRRTRGTRQTTTVQAHAGVVLQVQDLRVERDRRILDGVSFDVAAGGLTMLLGPSGSGKSTLLKAVVGLAAARGEIRVGGQWQRPGEPQAKRAIGFVPQDLQLYTNLNVLDNLVYFGAQFGIPKEKAKQTGLDILAMLGLEGLEMRPLARLSGGQQRRVSIAAALIHSPQLVVLDEPTSGLDLSARKSLWTMLQRLAHDRRVGVLATTHFIDDCQYASQVGILVEGRMAAMASPRQLLKSLPGEGRCVEIEFEEFDAATRKRFLGLLPELKSAGLIELADLRLHDVRCFARDPGRASRLLPELLHRRGFRVRSVRLDDVNLEDVFVHHTGRTGAAL